MSKARKICVVTGSRAEYGLLYWTMKKIEASRKYELQIIATAMHLSEKFDCTHKIITNDGFNIDYKIDMDLCSDSSSGIVRSLSLGQAGFARAYSRLKPDLILLLGDRFELLAAANAALLFRIPIAHCHGGERTEGLIDEAVRHSVTKMSHLHFVASDDSYTRLLQLGESPSRVFLTGAFGIETLRKVKPLRKKEFKELIGLDLKPENKIILVTYHPVTLEFNSAEKQLGELLNALAEIENCRIIFTGSNADTGGSVINKRVSQFVKQNSEKAVFFMNMGQKAYISALKYADVIVGNSSSGLLEAPTFKTACVNIGDRQKGRIRGDSVVDCLPDYHSISKAIKKVFADEFKKKLNKTVNPYDFGCASGKVLKILDRIDFPELLKKRFHDIKYIS